MKFCYQYRTKENEVRRGEIAAADRDAAFVALKAMGIKPSRVDEAPGFFNKLFGKGKRWIGIVVLGLGCLVLWYYLESTREDLVEATRVENAVPRHQIYGDPEIVAKFGHFEGLKSILGNDGDAWLGCFAQPGKMSDTRGWENGLDRKSQSSSYAIEKIAAAFEQALVSEQKVLPDDSREVKELKQIVNWLRLEMSAYVNYEDDLRSREQKFISYYNRLIQRVANEKRLYDMIERELKDCTDDRVREERNAKLRRLGLPTIVED